MPLWMNLVTTKVPSCWHLEDAVWICWCQTVGTRWTYFGTSLHELVDGEEHRLAGLRDDEIVLLVSCQHDGVIFR